MASAHKKTNRKHGPDNNVYICVDNCDSTARLSIPFAITDSTVSNTCKEFVCIPREHGEIKAKEKDLVCLWLPGCVWEATVFCLLPFFFKANETQLIEVSSLGAAITEPEGRQEPFYRASVSVSYAYTTAHRLAAASIKR